MDIALKCFTICLGYVIGQVIYMKLARDSTLDWRALPTTIVLVLILETIINAVMGAPTLMDMPTVGTVVMGCSCGQLISMKLLGR